MQRDRIARVYFQDVRRVAVKVSPYHVLGSAGYLIATWHSWAPADYIEGNSKSSHPAYPRAMAIYADRCEGIAVDEVCLACDWSWRHQFREGPFNIRRVPDGVLCQIDPKTEHPMR